MALMKKLGIMAKYWEPKEAPAVTALFVLFVLAVIGGLGYGVWSLFN